MTQGTSFVQREPVVQAVTTEYTCFSWIFLMKNDYLLSLKIILIPRRTQQTNICLKSTKDVLEQCVNYF